MAHLPQNHPVKTWPVSAATQQKSMNNILKKNQETTKARVNVHGEWICCDDVQFVDIEEDMQGFDVMTFNFRGKTHKSRIVNF